MVHILLGTWPRRIMTVLMCALSFVVSLTATLTIAVRNSPACVERVKGIAGVGTLAVKFAGLEDRGEAGAHLGAGDDVKTYRDVRPLSAEEIAQLIQDLGEQRRQYKQRRAEMAREQRRLTLYREELAKERQEIDAVREKVAAEWEALRKATSDLEKQTAIMRSDETKNLRKLAQQYESMKPETAASVLGEMPETMAAKILYLMRERSVAKVMERFDQGHAAKLSEKMAFLKRTN